MNETPEQVREWFQAALLKLWPVATGSLSLRRSPCIRTNCPVCERGEGHASYALYGRRKGKRFCIYIPDELVPDIQKAIANGRRLQDLINEAGVRYSDAVKVQRTKAMKDRS
jgi:hypothetical protein